MQIIKSNANTIVALAKIMTVASDFTTEFVTNVMIINRESTVDKTQIVLQCVIYSNNDTHY